MPREPLPEFLGAVFGGIRARSDRAFRRLLQLPKELAARPIVVRGSQLGERRLHFD